MPNLGPIPASVTLLQSSTGITSTNYAYTDAVNLGTRNQCAIIVNAIIGAGVTSLDIKIQSGLSSNGTFYDWVYLDEVNTTIVSGENLIPVRPYVLSIPTSTTLGPFNIPGTMPWVRVAYKVSGVGTANADIYIAYSVV